MVYDKYIVVTESFTLLGLVLYIRWMQTFTNRGSEVYKLKFYIILYKYEYSTSTVQKSKSKVRQKKTANDTFPT